MTIPIRCKGNDILEGKLGEFDAFVRAINKFGNAGGDRFFSDIIFEHLGKTNFSDELVLDSIARDITVPDITNYDVRITTSQDYSLGISIWTKKVEVSEEEKYGLESNVYVVSFPIAINHHRLIELEDKELFHATIKRDKLGSLGDCIRGIRIMRFIENIQDYKAAITDVQRGFEQVKKAYDQVSSQKG